jgi:hypothetical protein
MVEPVVLVSVILVAALVAPTACFAKATDAGLNVTLAPVAVTPTTCGLVGSLSLITRVPFYAPVDGGVNVRLTVHSALAANGLPEAGQVLEEMAKSAVSLRVKAPIRDAGLALVGDSDTPSWSPGSGKSGPDRDKGRSHMHLDAKQTYLKRRTFELCFIGR